MLGVKEQYLLYWETVLGGVLNWDSNRMMGWYERWLAVMDDENDILYHEVPSKYVAAELIPEELRSRLDVESRRLLVRQVRLTLEQLVHVGPNGITIDGGISNLRLAIESILGKVRFD